jgi:hypothetical protein
MLGSLTPVIGRLVVACFITTVFFQGCSSDSASGPETPTEEVTLIRLEDCVAGTREVKCYTLEILSQGIPAREVKVRAYQKENSRGAMILTTGGYGTNWYASSFGAEGVTTIETLYANGLEVYEVSWQGDKGWATNAEGFGYHKITAGYATLVKWMHDNVVDNPATIFAQGNSAGSFQNAYGLAMYGLEDYLDMVILSGGPPISDLRRGIFGEASDPARWPNGLAGFSITDYVMGWEGDGDYCMNRSAPEEKLVELDRVSLVSPSEVRLYHYKTKVHFVETNDPTAADHQGEIFYEAVTSEKHWYYFSEVEDHAVPGTAEGAAKIRQLGLEA